MVSALKHSVPLGSHKLAHARQHVIPNSDLSVCIGKPHADAGAHWVGSKVVCTLGPACQDVETLVHMLRAGMSVARCDLTWGGLEFHMTSLTNLQEAMKRTHKMCAVMVDTLGREVMVRRPFTVDSTGWPVHTEELLVQQDECIILTTDPGSQDVAELKAMPDVSGASESKVLSITCDTLPGLVEPGDTVYVGRYLACGAPEAGSLYMEVLQVTPSSILCKAHNMAELSGLLTVFHLERSEHELHNLESDLPVLSQFDKDCLAILAQEYEVDFIGLSYTRHADDVQEVYDFLDDIGLPDTKIVAKVETRQSLFNFQEILEASAGILVSRGLLGLDVPYEKMAMVQKCLVTACNLAGKPVIISRVLDSMSERPRPTRAEATDVANIILDGADGILLGQETLRGKYPVESVRTAVSIMVQAEAVFDYRHHYDFLMEAAMSAIGDLSPPLAAATFESNHLPGSKASRGLFESLSELPASLGNGLGPGSGYSSRRALASRDFSSRLSLGKQGTPRSMSYKDHPSYGSPIKGVTDGDTHPLPSPPTTSPVRGKPLSYVPELADGGVTFSTAGPDVATAAATRPGISVTGPHASQIASKIADHVADDVSKGSLMPADAGRATPIMQQALADRAGSGNAQHGGHESSPDLATRIGMLGSVSTTATDHSISLADLEHTIESMLAARGLITAHQSTVPGLRAAVNPADAAIPGARRASRFAPVSGPAETVLGSGGNAVQRPDGERYPHTMAHMSKLESITSSAVRAAEKVKASLIIVLTHTSNAPQLLAKYRPPMPILTLIVPTLVSDGLHWRLEGRSHARQCLLSRGLLPMLSAPGPTGDEVLEEAVATAARWGLVAPHQYVVVVERFQDNFAVKIVAVDALGFGIKQPGGVNLRHAGSIMQQQGGGGGVGPDTPRDVSRRAFTTMTGPGHVQASPLPTIRSMIPATPMVGRTLSMMEPLPYSSGSGASATLQHALQLQSPFYTPASAGSGGSFNSASGSIGAGGMMSAAAVSRSKAVDALLGGFAESAGSAGSSLLTARSSGGGLHSPITTFHRPHAPHAKSYDVNNILQGPEGNGTHHTTLLPVVEESPSHILTGSLIRPSLDEYPASAQALSYTKAANIHRSTQSDNLADYTSASAPTGPVTSMFQDLTTSDKLTHGVLLPDQPPDGGTGSMAAAVHGVFLEGPPGSGAGGGGCNRLLAGSAPANVLVGDEAIHAGPLAQGRQSSKDIDRHPSLEAMLNTGGHETTNQPSTSSIPGMHPPHHHRNLPDPLTQAGSDGEDAEFQSMESNFRSSSLGAAASDDGAGGNTTKATPGSASPLVAPGTAPVVGMGSVILPSASSAADLMDQVLDFIPTFYAQENHHDANEGPAKQDDEDDKASVNSFNSGASNTQEVVEQQVKAPPQPHLHSTTPGTAAHAAAPAGPPGHTHQGGTHQHQVEGSTPGSEVDVDNDEEDCWDDLGKKLEVEIGFIDDERVGPPGIGSPGKGRTAPGLQL